MRRAKVLCDYRWFVYVKLLRNCALISHLLLNVLLCGACCVFKNCFYLPLCAARFLLPVTVLTRYDTLVETVYSSFES